MASHNQLGKAGELAACRYLMKNGYRILATNWRSGYLEVDIVASDRRHLLIIEVKSRVEGSLYAPEDAVDRAKQKNLIAIAHEYTSQYRLSHLQVRYDVITALYRPAQGVFEITHLKDFFSENLGSYPKKRD